MDNHTTDKGWSAMREMLDREMPQQPNRRLVWWWLGLVLLPLAVFGSWKWLNPDSIKPTQPMVETQPIVAGKEQASPAHQKGQTIAPNTTQTPPITTFLQSQRPTSPPASGQLERKMGNAVQSVVRTPTLELTVHTNMEQAPGLQAIPEARLVSAPAYHTSLLPIQTPNPEFEITRSISAPAIGPTPSPRPIKPHSTNPWAIGAITAISCERFNQINGFSTGLNVDRKIAPKWGIRTGLLYNIYTPQTKTRPVASVVPDAYASNIAGKVIILDSHTGQEIVGLSNASFYSDSLNSDVFIPVTRMQRLEVPIAVFWQPIRPMKVFAGLHLSRTLTTKADRNNYTGNYILQLTDRTAEESVSKMSSNELNNWRADAALGLGFQAGRHLEFGVTGRIAIKADSKLASPERYSGVSLPAEAIISTRSRTIPVLSLYGTIIF